MFWWLTVRWDFGIWSLRAVFETVTKLSYRDEQDERGFRVTGGVASKLQHRMNNSNTIRSGNVHWPVLSLALAQFKPGTPHFAAREP